jgi:hypothetical protein
MSDLPTLMLGKDTLSGWDIMVAYDETSLNSCLAASFAQNPQLLTGLPAFAATYTGTCSSLGALDSSAS